MPRITLLAFALMAILTGGAYHGPQVDDFLPNGQSAWLGQEVAHPSSGGISHLVVFGDSLSDPGNLSRNTLGFFVPHNIFYQGRFSNGPVWADYVENALHWTVDNFAVGGARTRPGAFPESLAVPSLPEQIDKSVGRLEKLDAKKTLIAFWIGSNNYLRSGAEYQDANGKPRVDLLTQGVEKAIGEIENEIYKIQRLGFDRIVIGTIPELGGLNRDPKGSFPASDATLYLATRLHNQALSLMMERVRAKNGGLKLLMYDSYAINHATFKDPEAYGFSRLDAPCFVGSLSGNFYGKQAFCSDPMGYKFWEYVHPNTRMQCYYATQFLGDIADGRLIDGYSKEHAVARCLAIKNKVG
jgi:phospholipase/lecithinase/hemolysin